MALRELPRRLFTVDEYERMGEAGILGEDDRVELIEGEILEMVPIGSGHAAGVNRLTQLFSRALGDRAIVSVQNPVRLSDLSAPQPDLALLRPREDFYASNHPRPEDVLLLVEVVETSLAYDRAKLRVYAAAGISEVWLVNLPDGSLERYRRPGAAGFAETDVATGDAEIAPEAFPDVSFGIRSILGG
jgi:Uma2 family endonuclease